MPQCFNISNTAMASAFLNALVRLVSANHSKAKVTLPTGIVDVDELEPRLTRAGPASRQPAGFAMIIKIYDGHMAASSPQRSIKSKPGWRRPGIQVARYVKEITK